MGACLSKGPDGAAAAAADQPSFAQEKKVNSASLRVERAEPAAPAKAAPAVERDQVSPELPADIASWAPGDVSSWAAALGLPKASLTALQGVTGQQLLQLSDHRLLQLGVLDAAERHALLATRTQLQQEHAPDTVPAAQQPSSSTQAATKSSMPTITERSSSGALPWAGAGSRPEEAGLTVDAQPDTPSANTLSRYATVTPRQGSRSGDLSGPLQLGVSFAGMHQPLDDDAAAPEAAADSNVILEEMKGMQVLRITANGRLFRHSRPVPMSLVPYCQALCLLHDLRRGAHYHYDNCHQLLQRCVLVQDYLLALPHAALRRQTVMLSQLSLLVQDAYDVFSQFSERGWLLRLLNSVRDQDDFNRLDQLLVNAMEAAGADTSEQPIADLRRPHTYAPQQQQLEAALKHLGGITKLLRDPLSATIRLQSLLHHLPSGSNIDTLLQQEIDHYLSSQLWFSDSDSRPGSRESSFYVSSTASGSGSGGVGRAGSGGGSGGGMLRRQRSLGPGRRPATLSVVEPFMVLRNDTVRSEWRGAFGGRERVTWREFWYKLVQPQAHIWGLDQQLDKFTTDYVQQHLQCGSHGLLTIAELDFAFPPNSSPAMVIQAKLKEHSTTGSALPTFGSSAGNLSAKRPQGAAGWLRDLRVLQEPIPRLHNFPEFPVYHVPREEEVAELVLGMADVSTNLVMLTGSQGVGRSMLAASMAQELVVSHHWTDAYWIDLQGVSNVVLAGQQLMTGLGLTSDVPDTQQLLAWLEGRPRERFGIVLSHVQELLSAPAEEQQGFLDLLDNILHSSHKLQVVVVCEEPLSRITYLARAVQVEPLSAEVAGQMVQQAQANVKQEHVQCVVGACQGTPLALAVVCGLMRCGYCSAADFLRIYSDRALPIDHGGSDGNTSSYLPFESRQTHERVLRVLVAAAIALPDDLVTGLLVLSLLPAPFSFEMAAPLLALPLTNNERRAIMRRLVNLGLLSYNASLQLFTMHKLVRDAARLLVHNLGLPYNETRRRFAELLVSSARRLVLPLIAKNRMLSARLAWSRLSVHVVQLVNWAFTEVREDMLPLYVSMAWDLMPLLSSSVSSYTLQGFCQVVLERAQFLDMTLDSAELMMVLGGLLAESAALKRADAMLRQALEYFWRELKGPHQAVARCYKELGALMLKAGKPSEASKHLAQGLEMLETLYGGASAELLAVLQLQVELLRRSRKYVEAEGVVTRALGICGAAYGPNDVQVAVWKNQLAQVVRQAGRLDEAQSLAQEVLALLQGQLGSEHPRVAAQLMMLGQLAAQQGKQAAAEQTYRKALQVYQSVSGLHHPDTFNCLTSLVSLLRGAGKAAHALPLAQRCMAVKKKSLGELHPDTAASMQVVADVMLDLGKYAEVESHCSRAVWVYQQLNQPASSKPVIVATTMQALALVLLGRANEAEKLATDCLEAARHMSGPAAERNSFVASCHNCLGEVLREMGRLPDAEAAAREGLAMREKDLGASHPIVAISLQTLGHILRMRQQLEPALDVAQRCQALRASQPQGLQMAAALHLQALIYLDMGKVEEALAAGQAALSIRQKVLHNEHPDLAHSLTVVSEVLLMQDKHHEAEPLLSLAVQIFIGQLGSSHPATQRTHTLLKQATNPRTSTASSMSLGMRMRLQQAA
ncbi:hypothetical protein OEZ86_007890 [Tetradesmus obliquus]|nr:hypothetical protein OEZ86_007890 [Tetradesmus obliquus]